MLSDAFIYELFAKNEDYEACNNELWGLFYVDFSPVNPIFNEAYAKEDCVNFLEVYGGPSDFL